MRRDVSTFALLTALACAPAVPAWAQQTVPQTATPPAGAIPTAEEADAVAEPGPEAESDAAQLNPDEGEANEVDAVVVVGQRGAISRARAEERRSDNLTNVVSADSVGQFGDQNTAEALQRLPGVTIERNEGEGRFVSVRGLPSTFTQVTINGARVGTSEPGETTVGLDVVPSDLLGQIVVSKTYAPDMDGDTIGGSVELQSLSAFDQAKPVLAFRLQGQLQEYADELGPTASASLARRFLDGQLGVGLTVSYSNRFINGDDLRNEFGLLSVTRGGQTFLYPGEVNQRFEVGERERFGGTFNLEYRPTDTAKYYIRGQLSQLNDEDIRVQSLAQTERSTGTEIVAIADGSGTFNDVRLRNQTFFQPTEDRLGTISVGGENELGRFTLNYQADYSKSQWDQEDGVRGRFEIDDVQQILTFGEEDVFTRIRRESATRPDPANLANYRFVNLLFIEEQRVDEIKGVRVDLRRDVTLGGLPGFVKGGLKLRQREKTADKSEFNGAPSRVGINTSLADLPPLEERPVFGEFGPFGSLDSSRALFLRARDALLADPTFQRQDNTFASDFALTEDVTAYYLMGGIDFSDTLRLIGGLRVEQTEFASTGFFIETDANGLDAAGRPLTPIDLGGFDKSYTNYLPSGLLRWEPTPQLVVRAGYGRGLKRPDFEDSDGSQRVSFDTPANRLTTRQLTASNPFLEPLTADQYDASVAWYPNRNTVLQVTVFHKEIKDFFLDLTTTSLADTPLVLPAGVPTAFRRISTTINGGDARITGAEISYSQVFANLPGVFSGLFAEANLTIADSEAQVSFRPDETFPFPDQADSTGNVSLGYEDDRVSLRLSANYRGETLAGLSDDKIEDRFRASYTQYDLNVRFNVNERIQLYADGINLSGEKDVRFYRGDLVRFFERVQDFGSTYQVGVRATF